MQNNRAMSLLQAFCQRACGNTQHANKLWINVGIADSGRSDESKIENIDEIQCAVTAIDAVRFKEPESKRAAQYSCEEKHPPEHHTLLQREISQLELLPHHSFQYWKWNAMNQVLLCEVLFFFRDFQAVWRSAHGARINYKGECDLTC
jgi:hypothetical protein